MEKSAVLTGTLDSFGLINILDVIKKNKKSSILPEIKTEKLIISLSRNLSENEVKKKITNDSLVFEPEDVSKSIDLSLNDVERTTLALVNGKNDVLAIESKVLVDELLKARHKFIDLRYQKKIEV